MNYNQIEKESNYKETVSGETIFDSEKGYFDYLINIKSQDIDNSCDFCAAFMTF
jgi:hypothetical protein